MKAEEPIQGEYKIFEVDHDFTFRGEQFKKGEKLEVTAEDCKQLMAQRTLVAFDDGSKLNLQAGRMVGGPFTLERCKDGYHKISFWNKSYWESDPWAKVEFLTDVHGLAGKGEQRRLHKSDALEMSHRYLDSNEPLPPGVSLGYVPMPATTLILENKPRPLMSPEEVRLRAAAVEAGRAREDGWMSSLKRI